jgi:plasmid stabilization system protein ParE
MIAFSPDALADIERLRTFLDEINPGAARRAMAAILMAIERLQEFPDLGMTTADADIRQIVVRNYGDSTLIYRGFSASLREAKRRSNPGAKERPLTRPWIASLRSQ